jgi:fructose-bisphosphate aldolase class II
MIDGSMLPFEENIALTKKVVDYAHSRGVTVEGELGSIAGTEEGVENNQTDTQYTDPALAEEFVKRTKVDSLAISIGTVHGLVKIKPKPDGTLPDLRYDILEEIEKRMPGFPIVLHGASSIPSEYVEMINKYGGKIEAARGIPEDQIARVSRMAVCKINIASDGWICAMANTRKILAENPSAIDSRVFTLKIRPILADLYKKKIELLGSENRI